MTLTAGAFNLADLYEAVADAAPDREVLVSGERRLTHRQLEERANRLANALAERGIGPGDTVGLQLTNGTEYVEGMLAAFKLRAIPVNINYRYVERELRYLYEDSGLAALIHHRGFGDRVAQSLDQPLRALLTVEDGSDAPLPDGAERYDDVLAAADADRPAVDGRSGDDLYLIYTGGTTGMPKGVVWRHEDIFKSAMGGGDLTQGGDYVSGPKELAERLPENGIVALAGPPLMHAAAHWLTFHQLFTGGVVVLMPGGRFDPPGGLGDDRPRARLQRRARRRRDGQAVARRARREPREPTTPTGFGSSRRAELRCRSTRRTGSTPCCPAGCSSTRSGRRRPACSARRAARAGRRSR